jgi:hypothetical protein
MRSCNLSLISLAIPRKAKTSNPYRCVAMFPGDKKLRNSIGRTSNPYGSATLFLYCALGRLPNNFFQTHTAMQLVPFSRSACTLFLQSLNPYGHATDLPPPSRTACTKTIFKSIRECSSASKIGSPISRMSVLQIQTDVRHCFRD